ncbi:unnamed protein product, partial [Ectocarpus sp. 12 AP-2014]
MWVLTKLSNQEALPPISSCKMHAMPGRVRFAMVCNKLELRKVLFSVKVVASTKIRTQAARSYLTNGMDYLQRNWRTCFKPMLTCFSCHCCCGSHLQREQPTAKRTP